MKRLFGFVYRLRARHLILFAFLVAFLFFAYQAIQLSRLSRSTLSKHRGGNNNNNNNDPRSSSSAAAAISGSRTFIGVSPHDIAAYETAFQAKIGYFRCIYSGESITESGFNDDYCDCADGSDEPSTSACAHLDTRFFCKSSCVIPHFRTDHLSIPTSRVNDGICDCCDGSDESVFFVHDRSRNMFLRHLTKYIDPSKLNNKLQSCIT